MSFRTNISMDMFCNNNNKLFFHLPPTSRHLYPLPVGGGDINAQLVVDEDDNGKFKFVRVNSLIVFSSFTNMNNSFFIKSIMTTSFTYMQ